MPVYVVEFETHLGPERRPFTIDDDRPLQGQLGQVLDELGQSGRVLEGGPGDVLGASWNGNDLELARSCAQLGLTPERPLVLRMRARLAPTSDEVAVAPRGIDWTRVILPSIEGALGAVIAWFLTWGLADIRAPLQTVDQVDVTATILLAVCTVVAVAIGAARRSAMRSSRAVLWCLISPLAGMATFGALMLVDGAPDGARILGGRIAAWVGIGVLVTVPAAAMLSARAVASVASASLVAAAAGAMAALIMSLPGPSLLLQALAFIVLGAGVGFAAVGAPMWRLQVARS